MRVIDLENINLAMRNEEQFVLRCEEVYHDKISSAAATILAGKSKKPIVALTGPSGSGKSTLLRSLNLLEEPTAGQIIFDGVDLADKSVDINLHRQKMGMVFQHFNLFPHMTILDNMTLAPIHVKHMLKAEAEQKVHALLERVGPGDRAEAYPIQLSGGQKRRVAVAGVMAMKPRILVLDEPAAGLDPEGRDDILS